MSVQHTKSQRIQWLTIQPLFSHSISLFLFCSPPVINTYTHTQAPSSSVFVEWCRWYAHAIFICETHFFCMYVCERFRIHCMSIELSYAHIGMFSFPQLDFIYISSHRRLFRIHSNHLLFCLKFSCRFFVLKRGRKRERER